MQFSVLHYIKMQYVTTDKCSAVLFLWLFFDSVTLSFSLNPECRRLRISLLDKEEQQEYYSRLHPVVKILTHLLLK